MNEMFARLGANSGGMRSILRVVTGVLLAWHGYRKFADGLDGFEGFLTFLELPAPGLLAFVVAALELVGGILLAAGALTRLVSLLFVIQFALIVVWVKLIKLDSVLLVGGESPGLELDLLFLSLSAYFFTAGPGPLSADAMFGLESNAASRAEDAAERAAAAV